MSFIDAITPKDTEEIKPDLFVQKKRYGYKQINPLAWGGRFRWNEQLRTLISFGTIFRLAIIIFIAWSYFHDVCECLEVNKKLVPMCEEEEELCIKYGFIDRDYKGYEVNNEKVTNPLQDFIG